MQKDYYEPVDPQPINEGGEIPNGQTGTSQAYSDGSMQGGGESGGVTQMAAKAQDQAKEIAGQAQEKVGNVATMARERTDQGVDRAAEGLHTAAEKMREHAETREGVHAQVGTKVADTLDRTSSYLKEHDTAQMWDEVETFVRQNPMQAAAGALVAGFLLGRIFR